MIKVPSRGTIEERLRLLEFSVNYSEVDLPFPVSNLSFGLTVQSSGGFAVDRSVFRKLLPNARWVMYAAGLVSAGDANTATVSLVYVTDALAQVSLGSLTYSAAAFVKRALGPFDVFGTGGVPAGETIPMFQLNGVKNAGVNGNLVNWCIWLRLLANKQ